MSDSRADVFVEWSRRLLAGRFARRPALALGLTAALLPLPSRGRKGKNKPLRRNGFGCVNVGNPCRGKDGACCSGICRGRRPNNGEHDESRCIAHDVSSCQAGQETEFCGGTTLSCTTTAGDTGFCNTTTGNAGYCAVSYTCLSCTKDTDCQATLGPRAACARCAGCSTGVVCAYV